MKTTYKYYFILVAAFLFADLKLNAQNWQLIWSDEFTNNIGPDWHYAIGTGNNGWANSELEYYRQENATVQNGQLLITAKKENFGGRNYTSARMETGGQFSFTYGKIEARMAVPNFMGAWPAFWMMGSNIGSVGWPACGEIDIMEHVNTGDAVFGTIHWDNNGNQQYGNSTNANNISAFHTYTVIWDANAITWYIDGVQFHTASIANNVNGTDEFHKPFYFLLNLAVGGSWPGFNIDDSAFPVSLAVDYIRVYQDNPTVSTTGLVTAYKDCNYSGFSGGLNVGDYTTAQLGAMGVLDNDISSLKITEGYKAILYDNDNFGGASVEVTSDNNCLGGIGWNDKVGSIRIRTNGVTNMSGTYYLQNRNSGLFMDVNGGNTATGDGVNISQWSATNTDNQKFQFIHLGDGTYEVLAAHSQKSVDVSGGPGAVNDGVNVQQWTYLGGSNQQFIVVPVTGNYYKLIAKHSGKVVEVAGASTAVGGNVQQWTNNNQTCGQWNFVPVQTAYNVGDGIRADYFNGQNFETWRTTKKENNINFGWGNGSPDASVDADNFSARWTGKIQPRYSGTYTFYINSDNGRRLWINNQLIIDKWLNDWGTDYTGTIALEAGKKYDIVIEYFEAIGGAGCKLDWSSSLQGREVVPQGQLFSNQAPTVSITAPANNATYVAAATIAFTATANDPDGSISKVEFYNGTTKLGEDASSPYNFNWTNVAAGTYTVTAKAIDNQGVFTNSSAITVKVNANQNPTVSITAPTNNASFTSPAAVNITANAADADGTVSKVDFYYGTTLLGSDNSSPYSYSWTGLAAGTYIITAKATDDKGGVTTSTSISIVVNNPNQAPTVSITAPSNNATFIAAANVNITATANDTDGNIAKVEFYNGATLLGSLTAPPYTYNWTNVAAGTYTITAKATDNLGLSTTSSAITVKVNANQNPTVNVNATSTTPNTINITATATDGDGSIVKVEYYDGTTLIGSSTTLPYTFTWTGASAGNHSITAVAIDDKGGKTTSTAVVVTVVNPNSPPTVSITGPANNSVYVASASITLTANANDPDGSISKVEFYNGTTLLGGTIFSPFAFVWTNVPAGTYTITAKAIDMLGVSTTSTAITIKVNANQNPTVSITSPANNANFTAPATIGFTASAADIDGSISKVEFFNGATLLGTATTIPYIYYWTNVASGTYNITAKATDDKGGVTTSNGVIINVNVLNNPPVVSITSPTNNANYVAAADITIAANATDDGSITKVEFYNGSNLLGISTSTPFTYNWTGIPAGTYSITAKAFDNLGLSTTSTPVSIIVNANQSPVVSINATSTTPNTVEINVTATDGDGTITKVEYYDGVTKIGESTSSPYTFTWTNVSAGSHTITAKAFDDKGGVTTTSAVNVNVTNPISNVEPSVTITSPLNHSTFDEPARITITANASDSDGSIARVEFYNGATKLGESTVAPYSFDWTIVPAGSYTIIVIAVDNKGLGSEATVEIKVQSTTAVINYSTSAGITVYPNPTVDMINFSSDIMEVNIFSLSGKKLESVKLNGQTTLDLSSYTSGVYLIQMITDKQTNFIKVTKE